MQCDHDFPPNPNPPEKGTYPHMVDPDSIEDRTCTKCGVIFRAFKEVWAKVDAEKQQRVH